MFVGKYDRLADPADAEWTLEALGESVISYQEIDGGHLTFFIAKDMTYFNHDVMDILRYYQPL
jgi:hypothetical protein